MYSFQFTILSTTPHYPNTQVKHMVAVEHGAYGTVLTVPVLKYVGSHLLCGEPL